MAPQDRPSILYNFYSKSCSREGHSHAWTAMAADTVRRTGLSDMYTGKCIAPLSDGAERLAVWSFRIDPWPVRRGCIATKAFLAFLSAVARKIRAAERISR